MGKEGKWESYRELQGQGIRQKTLRSIVKRYYKKIDPVYRDCTQFYRSSESCGIMELSGSNFFCHQIGERTEQNSKRLYILPFRLAQLHILLQHRRTGLKDMFLRKKS